MSKFNIEKLFSKFGCKAISYNNQPHTSLLSVDDQLAAIGITWKYSITGWLTLMVEVLKDSSSYHQLFEMVKIQAAVEMKKFKGPFHKNVLLALGVTAIAESISADGVLCGECSGTNKILYNCGKEKVCDCNKGKILWSDDMRYAKFCYVFPVTRPRFDRYRLRLKSLTEQIFEERKVALLAIQSQLILERDEARKIS